MTRTMRIAIGQLWQETNTFNPLPTTRADFEAFGILRGEDVVSRMAETNELTPDINDTNETNGAAEGANGSAEETPPSTH